MSLAAYIPSKWSHKPDKDQQPTVTSSWSLLGKAEDSGSLAGWGVPI